MHGLRVELLHRQALSIGLPLEIVEIPEMPTMEAYENAMAIRVRQFKKKGINHAVFGDIFLEDLRRYREEQLAKEDIEAVFPLWQIPSYQLLDEFLSLGFKTIVVCVNERYLDKSFVGRVIDHQFISDLPEGVDVCGENGEFHTFTFDGPLFSEPIPFTIGETVYRKYEKPETDDQAEDFGDTTVSDPYEYGFWYCDLLPK